MMNCMIIVVYDWHMKKKMKYEKKVKKRNKILVNSTAPKFVAMALRELSSNYLPLSRNAAGFRKPWQKNNMLYYYYVS